MGVLTNFETINLKNENEYTLIEISAAGGYWRTLLFLINSGTYFQDLNRFARISLLNSKCLFDDTLQDYSINDNTYQYFSILIKYGCTIDQKFLNNFFEIYKSILSSKDKRPWDRKCWSCVDTRGDVTWGHCSDIKYDAKRVFYNISRIHLEEWNAYFKIFVDNFRSRSKYIHYLISVYGNTGSIICEYLEANSLVIPNIIYPDSLEYKRLIKCLIERYMLRYENKNKIKEIFNFILDLDEVDYDPFIYNIALRKYLRLKQDEYAKYLYKSLPDFIYSSSISDL